MEEVMLSKFIAIGDKIELQPIGRGPDEQTENEQNIYHSSVHDLLSEDTMEIIMPMEHTKLVLLPVDSEYDLVIYGTNGLYQCFARVIDRYKSNNVYILVMELISNLRKFQRRDFYRFSCALEMSVRMLEEEEANAVENKKPYELQSNLPLKQSVIVDISGGGIRFVSTQKYEPASLLYCSYNLLTGGTQKKYEIIGKVLAVKEVEYRPGTYEHRVQYYNLDKDVQEEIIKFIFEEERKERKKERLM